MLNGGKLDGHSIALFSEKTDDHYLERMFQIAASNAPALIVLEDIDRAFPQVPSQLAPTKVSLSHLLNCLDGLGTQEGVVVVATANNPTDLDRAILQRPADLTASWNSRHRMANYAPLIFASLFRI